MLLGRGFPGAGLGKAHLSCRIIKAFLFKITSAALPSQYPQEFSVDSLVGGDNGVLPGFQGLSLEVGDQAAGFGDQKGAAGKLPGIQK